MRCSFARCRNAVGAPRLDSSYSLDAAMPSMRLGVNESKQVISGAENSRYDDGSRLHQRFLVLRSIASSSLRTSSGGSPARQLLAPSDMLPRLHNCRTTTLPPSAAPMQ